MNSVIERVGWTLVHSLWEGAVIWLVLWIALRMLGRCSAHVRYLTACGALVLAVLAPWVTYLRIDPGSLARPVPMITGQFAPTTLPATASVTPIQGQSPIPWSDIAQHAMSRVIPWLVLFWALGFAWSALRLAVGWRVTRRLLRAPRHDLGEVIEGRCRDLAERLGIKRMIEIGASTLVKVPSVVSWLEPIILVPAGAFAGLTAVQVEGLIAHELAHIVRHDFIVNVLQSFCEVVFFFHPAVHMINRIIRTEREHACDDIAVKLVGDPHGYAAALAYLEETRHPELVLAASGHGSLLERVRRLVAPVSTPVARPLGTAWVVLVGVVLYVATLLLIPGFTSRAHAAQSPEPGQAQESATADLYRLQAGDRLRVVVFDGTTAKDSLGFVLRCDAEGNLLVPVIGPVHVGGLTLAQAGRVLEEAYRQSFNLTKPNVTVMVLEYAPREVTISGQVRNPSRYMLPIEGSYTPLELVEKAGGFTDTADGSAVRIVSVLPDGTTRRTVVDVEKVIEGRAVTPDDTRADTLRLRPGDIVYVPALGVLARAGLPPPGRSNFEAMAALQFDAPDSIMTSKGSAGPKVRSLVDLHAFEQILVSARLRQKVIASYSPAELEMLRRPFAGTAFADNIFGYTRVESDNARSVIYIFSEHPDPTAAALIANRFASQFMAQLDQEVKSKDDVALDFLRQRVAASQQKSQAADKEFNAFLASHAGDNAANMSVAERSQEVSLKKMAESTAGGYHHMLIMLEKTEASAARQKVPIKQIVYATAPNG